MNHSFVFPPKSLARFGAALAMLVTIGQLPAGSSEKALHRFRPHSDAYSPVSPLIADGRGNLYGTAQWGAGNNCALGCGAVFKIAPDGTETLLHIFAGGNDGAYPFGGLLRNDNGDLFGTTSGYYGGGYGTVFKLASNGKETVLHSFQGGSDGLIPWSTLVADKDGNLYGTTEFGANAGCLNGLGCGIVFKIAPKGEETVLYTFQGSPDGGNSVAGLTRDSEGNLYGTTAEGGATCSESEYGCGTVFELTPTGTETVLYSFKGGSDGYSPGSSLLIDAGGNLYGTTTWGGSCSRCGTVFRIAQDGTETVLHSFQGGSDGETPFSGVIEDGSGILYGTTLSGGGGCEGDYGCGTVFKLAPDGTETVLQTFLRARKGFGPRASLLLGKSGFLYGTTESGGVRNFGGVVFRIRAD
jgi:uncharacterized repeat protein (TIGR03803 family)